jgi:type I restriction-modification system DNA methylase subunit
MTDVQQRAAAKMFAAQWKDKGYEKGESQPFWLSLLRDVFGVDKPETFISFEEQVHLDHTSFIDGSIPSTHVLIEQKGINKDLRSPIKQSDGSMLNPFQQAKRYAAELSYSNRPRWIVTCNFAEFLVYDMERPNSEPESILLANLEKEYYRLNFLVDDGNDNIRKEMEVSLKAGELVGKLYDALLLQYADPTNEHSLKSLNQLCVRLVFCLYAEDAGIFGKHDAFHDYIAKFNPENVRVALKELFKMLDTKIADRDPYDDKDLLAFPYVNGGLFADEYIEIPRFTEEIIHLILKDCSLDFDWSGISPTIFGAVFESTLNPETRRSGGMHYTSIENIHKVIDPLFLDSLKQEFNDIKAVSLNKARGQRLHNFQDKLASLTFLDPACGSGNFLTETFLSLRRIENDVLKEIRDDGQISMGGDYSPIKVSIQQFYGIEINDFAVTVSKTALWIAESQMMKETEDIVGGVIDFLPLKTYTNIVEGNALTTDWESVVPKEKLNYIMGNPPFVGASMMSKEQKDEAVAIFGKIKLSNSIDFVGAWYYKAAMLMQNTNIQAALVSTNSITQGEQVAPLWKNLIEKYHIHIDFAYRTFRWDSEAKIKAHVHCVIIGFSSEHSNRPKIIFDGDSKKEASNINPYLLDASDVYIESRSTPICNVFPMTKGNQPSDGGNLILSPEEKDEILKREPELSKYIFPYIGSVEYINKKVRYCFWLKNTSPSEIKNSKELYQRIEAVKEMRLASSAKPTRLKAQTPHIFFSPVQPNCEYLMIPRVSSERRRYIPIGFMTPDIIASDSCSIIPNASLFYFGILTSNVHNAWMRVVCGRLKSDYRYSGSVVYNNFPWPSPTDEQKTKIEETAQAILDARALYPDSSLADLYDEVTMPVELRKAHQNNDRAVMQAYGFSIKDFTEADCVAALMEMYKKLSSAAR